MEHSTRERGQFTFYASFASALARIRKKSDRADAYDAICRYALYGELPDLETMADSAAIAFDLIRPTLDASRRKAESGRMGGLRRQSESRGEAEGQRREGEREKEREKEKKGENDCSLPLAPPGERRQTKKQGPAGPTLEQVEDFARRRKAQADPRAFFDYYAAAAWRDGQGKPVYNWQQKFIAWDLRERSRRPGGGGTAPGKPGKPGENTARMREYLRQQQKQEEEGSEP